MRGVCGCAGFPASATSSISLPSSVAETRDCNSDRARSSLSNLRSHLPLRDLLGGPGWVDKASVASIGVVSCSPVPSSLDLDFVENGRMLSIAACGCSGWVGTLVQGEDEQNTLR